MTAPVRSGQSTRGASATLERYEAVIGIEVHCQLRTVSKMFCSCSTAYDGAPPNSHTCPVCLGLPGALPTINRQAVEHVLTTGLAIGASAPPTTRRERKNYFYPDLPKGYQISQYEIPLMANGTLTFDTSGGPVTVGIRRAHLEEDTAKLIHAEGADGRRVSLVDFNRSGVPLMEIVTEADLRSAEASRRYAEELQLLLRTIGVSDADMERGQMRVEANVSIRPRGEQRLGIRVEVKNMNSFRSVERAIGFEIERQAELRDAGGAMVQETRGWSDDRGSTYPMRTKEDSEDYRYFPEPDLPPLSVDRAWIERLKARLPELPSARRGRYLTERGLSSYDANVIVNDPRATEMFEAVLAADASLPPKEVANWVTNEYLRLLGRVGGDGTGFSAPGDVPALIRLVVDGRITKANAKEVFEAHVVDGRRVEEVIRERGFHQISDAVSIDAIVDEVIAANPKAVADYRAGKPVIGFFVGQVMKATRGQANAGLAEAAIRARLDGAGAGEG
ncbi:MAG: Asp-tRNA(Asn)/Glu-tRNA(Gln) amidotransferase subunit GatB [Chloroflexi bacterium]|nr:MAG: Asp-tRNA(Asn)/Glu-tRNA(Gln) amidotransferase subunit GatB [Chloroflexota bacterium]